MPHKSLGKFVEQNSFATSRQPFPIGRCKSSFVFLAYPTGSRFVSGFPVEPVVFSSRPDRGVFAIKPKRQAFGAAARFDELVQFGRVGGKSVRFQVCFQLGAARVEHHLIA